VNEALGLFVPGQGPLYRIHPLPKLLFTLWGVIAPFVLPVEALPVMAVAIVVGALLAGLGRVYVRRLLLMTLPSLTSIVLINGFFFPGARDVLLSAGPLGLTREGLEFGLPIAGRVLVAVAVTLAFVTTTRPDDLMAGLVRLGAPTSITFLVLSAIQAVPRMRAKASRILDAQQARGLRTRGGPLDRMRGLIPLVAPLVIGSLVDARDRALALEARGFGSSGQRTVYRLVPWRRSDRLLAAAAIAALAALPIVLTLRLARLI
jgi:energy-coupling factor transport system permease protein